jgi:RNA polymerase sigma-70 factor, ECF subfamily
VALAPADHCNPMRSMSIPSPQHERFIQLFLPLQSGLQGYLRTLIPNRSDAEDVLQAVATVIWERFDEFQPGTRFDSWAYQIAYLQALRFLKERKRSKLVFSEDVVTLLADEAAKIGTNTSEVVDALDLCVEELPEIDRDLLRLRFESGANNRSVASVLGRSEGAISRALTRLYRDLLHCIQRRTTTEKAGGPP